MRQLFPVCPEGYPPLHLGVAEPVAGSLRPGVAKLADAVSADWMRQYRLDLAVQV